MDASAIGKRASKFDVVILFSSDNFADVRAICDELGRNGINYWRDDERVRGGDVWREHVERAVRETPVIAFVFGKEGPAFWQQSELQFALEICRECSTEGEKRIVPVVLPGGSAPKQVGLVGRTPIEFHDDVNDAAAFSRLLWAITGQKRHERLSRYQILVDVGDPQDEAGPESTCFLGFTADTPEEVTRAIRGTAKSVGLRVLERQDPRSEESFDIESAIRAAGVLIVDCSSGDGDQPNYQVMYELGLAMALGKYIVLVANADHPPPAVITFSPNLGKAAVAEGNDGLILYEYDGTALGASFAEKLGRTLKTIAEELRYPFLTRRAAEGVGVAFADAFHLRVSLWDKLETVIMYGLAVDKAFRELFREAAKLNRDLCLLQRGPNLIAQLTGLIGPLTSDEAHQKLDQLLRGQGATPREYDPPTEVVRAFQILTKHATGEAQSAITKSESFFQEVTNAIKGHFMACDSLRQQVEAPGVPEGYLIERLTSSDMAWLNNRIENVHDKVYGMLTALVGVIGARRKG